MATVSRGKLTKADLIKICLKLGIATSGNVHDLRARLEVHDSEIAAATAGEDDSHKNMEDKPELNEGGK